MLDYEEISSKKNLNKIGSPAKSMILDSGLGNQKISEAKFENQKLEFSRKSGKIELPVTTQIDLRSNVNDSVDFYIDNLRNL